MRDLIVSEIVLRVQSYYVRDDAGTADAANVVFVAEEPTVPHSRLCVGGESSQGALYLGAASLDVNNAHQVRGRVLPRGSVRRLPPSDGQSLGR